MNVFISAISRCAFVPKPKQTSFCRCGFFYVPRRARNSRSNSSLLLSHRRLFDGITRFERVCCKVSCFMVALTSFFLAPHFPTVQYMPSVYEPRTRNPYAAAPLLSIPSKPTRTRFNLNGIISPHLIHFPPVASAPQLHPICSRNHFPSSVILSCRQPDSGIQTQTHTHPELILGPRYCSSICCRTQNKHSH